ncbi:MAG: hypothetical protein AABY68_13140 [Pseudomonadota bacterium]
MRQNALPIGFLSIFFVLLVIASSGPIQWMDNGNLMHIAAHDGLFPMHVDALSHPAFHLLSVIVFRLFGPELLSLLNVFLLALAGCLVYRIVIRLGESREVAWLAVFAMMACHSVIWVATKFEVYFLCMDFVLLFVLRYISPGAGLLSHQFLLGLLAGFALASHQIALLMLLPFGLVLIMRGQGLFALLAGCLVGLFPLFPAVVNDLKAGTGILQLVLNFLMVGGGRYQIDYQSSFMDIEGLLHSLPQTALLLLSLVGIAGLGLLSAGQRGASRLIYLSGVLVAVFAILYRVDDKFTFLAPAIPFLAISGAIFLRSLDLTKRKLILLSMLSFLPMLLMHLAILMFSAQLQMLGRAGGVPERSDIVYYGAPLLGDDSAERFVRRLQKVGGVMPIYADWSSLGALQSGQVMGYLPGLVVDYCGNLPGGNAPATLLLVRKHIQCELLFTRYAPVGMSHGAMILQRI